MESITIKIAALSDIHVTEQSKGTFAEIFTNISKEAQVLVLCGDLTNGGHPAQAEVLCDELASCTIPIVAVLGNHDHEAGHADEVKSILTKSRITVLDGTTTEINGVSFAGSKGFCGGFGKYMLASFGEQPIKTFVKESVDETLRVENAISQMTTKRKVLLLHYSPIVDTVRGEPPEIFPFLGSSRLEEPIDRYDVSMVFHGHAHNGTHQGKTLKNIPVYNVCYSLLRKMDPQKPYKIFEV